MSIPRGTLPTTAAVGAAALFLSAIPALADPLPTPSGSPIRDGARIPVSDGPALEEALAQARPGDTIELDGGTYTGAFVITTAGTADAPITLTGPSDAVLVNDETPSGSGCPTPETHAGGYGLWFYEADHWNVEGVTVADSKKGIVIDRSDDVHLSGIEVRDVEDEGVHFRSSSSDGSIRDSRIRDTGLVQPGFGEGVYLGSAVSNWGCYGTDDGVDRSDRIEVTGNHFGPYVRGEHIDVKEGTSDGLIADNTFDGQGISGQNFADSWVDVKGNGYLFEGNVGTFTAPGVFAHGYTSTQQVDGQGCGNVFRDNHSDLGGVGGFAIALWSQSDCADDPNVVYESNTVDNASRGLTNIDVTP
ncbi:right-handed parallel beta-helix repeat-containing protein [Nocardiopsis alba]|uniref:Right handed beta helix region family protein n=1 Tax=Nocardiopsis alba (strain ATCC BAA-2165 / BE74) TaxID=1205910 RepID=J7LJS0_NOCAA|nr:right-handed parallel beta-helix repeat-containing protein [Nocardiopsis alba]AFR10967.1 right handed beta helix region family protein [Nocardiopsis alba ATCC BAA-2165]